MLFVLFLTYAVLGAIFGVLQLGQKRRLKANAYAPDQTTEEDLQEEDEEEV